MLGQINTRNKNLQLGEGAGIDRRLLFLGLGTTVETTLTMFNEQTDLDAVLEADSPLLINVQATVKNAVAGGSIFGAVCKMATGSDWRVEADKIINDGFIPEAIVLVDVPADKAAIEAVQTYVNDLEAKGVFIYAMVGQKGIDTDNQTWGQYQAALNLSIKDIVAENVCLVPYITPDALGVRVGRMNREDFSIADTAVKTIYGPISSSEVFPVDSAGIVYDNAIAMALDSIRLSVPQTYPSKAGVYLGDSNTLDTTTGDFQTVERIRPILKAERLVHDHMFPRIGDSSINDTPVALKAAASFASKPLYDMAKPQLVGGKEVVGVIAKPQENDVVVKFVSTNEIQVSLGVRLIDSPKKINNTIFVKRAEG